MLLKEKLHTNKIILASQSPRRKELLKKLGIDFIIKTREINESYPPGLVKEEIPLYLCRQKANEFDESEIEKNTILITADTIVWLDGNKVLGKPIDKIEAVQTLKELSGKKHEVITGVCLRSLDKITTFHISTEVFFKVLSNEEIDYYIDTCKPYDKAGAYGIQEWIGYIGIEKINGSFNNVVGLPVKALYDALMEF